MCESLSRQFALCEGYQTVEERTSRGTVSYQAAAATKKKLLLVRMYRTVLCDIMIGEKSVFVIHETSPNGRIGTRLSRQAIFPLRDREMAT